MRWGEDAESFTRVTATWSRNKRLAITLYFLFRSASIFYIPRGYIESARSKLSPGVDKNRHRSPRVLLTKYFVRDGFPRGGSLDIKSLCLPLKCLPECHYAVSCNNEQSYLDLEEWRMCV